MSRPADIGKADRLRFSVEIFPPREEDARERLAAGLKDLEALAPSFVSVTYGAGGTTRERTVDMVARLQERTSLVPAAHLTCVSSSVEEIDAMVARYWEAGVRRVVALRGDPPGGLDVPYAPHPQGYRRTADLVAGIRRLADFDVSVSAYPEKHPQSADFDADLDVLAAKVDAGAARAITQFFFDNDLFLRYRDRVRARGIAVAIIPGIMPVVNLAQLTGFAGKCGASVPAWLSERYAGLDDDPAGRARVAVETAVEQIAGLAEAGVEAVHLYCLNRVELARDILEQVAGARPATAAA